jgi:hypothetical protein
MLSVIMLNVVYAEGHGFICRLSDVMPNGILLSVVMQNVVYVGIFNMLSVITLNGVMLSVVHAACRIFINPRGEYLSGASLG